MTTQTAPAVQQQPSKPPGLISQVFSILVSLLFFMIVSIISSVIIEWIGLSFIWTDEAETHAYNVLQVELEYANNVISEHVFRDFIAEYYTFFSEGFKDLYISVSSFFSQTSNKNLEQTLGYIGVYGQSAFYVSQVVILRLIMVIASVFLYLAILFQATVDGFIARELRRLGGGREKDKRYRLARRSLMATFFLGNILYVAWPDPVHPLIFILPVIIIMYFSLRTTIYRFQKYF